MATKSYRIVVKSTAEDLGVFEGETAEEAVNAMHVDAGYASTADCAERVNSTPAQLLADLMVNKEPQTESVSSPAWLQEAERNESLAFRQWQRLKTAQARDVWEHCQAILDLARSAAQPQPQPQPQGLRLTRATLERLGARERQRG